MTSISSLTYATTGASLYATPTATQGAAKVAATTDDTGSGAAVNVTLSEAAKAALKAQAELPSLDTILSAARTAIDKLLAQAKTKDALVDGRATIDMGGLDRRSLFAVSTGARFTASEKTLAAATLQFQFEDALAGPVAASRVTGDYATIYKAGLAFLDKAGPEEKATATWATQREALLKGYQQATANPGVAPSKIPNDPVAAYMAAQDAGGPVTAPRDILSVADDVRAALDAQYEAAAGAKPSLADFDGRALAAIALNKGGLFSEAEVRQAQLEIRDRNSASLSESYGSNIAAGSAGTLGRDLIARYASMSPEEREAQGWTPELYAKLVQNYQTSQRLAAMPGGAMGGLYGDASGGGGGGSTSLLDYLT